MTIRIFLTAIFISALILGLPQGAAAEAVGHFTQVEGRVDLLKGGKLPATAVKVGDGVEQGDVLRTKSLSKAQVTFKDNSTLTISPESRIAIEEYMVDAAKGQRNALLQVFQGMVLAVVSKIYQTEKPDFVVKTHTAIMGIRGTEVGIRLAANDTTFLNFQGKTQVANIFPEVGDSMFKKANKIAFAQGQPSVMLKDSQGCTVARGLPPTLPYTIGPEDRKLFMRAFNIAPLVTKSGGGDAAGRGGGQRRRGRWLRDYRGRRRKHPGRGYHRCQLRHQRRYHHGSHARSHNRAGDHAAAADPGGGQPDLHLLGNL